VIIGAACPFALGTLLSIWTSQIWLPTVQANMIKASGITGPEAIQSLGWGTKLWGIGGILGYICFGYLADWFGRRLTIEVVTERDVVLVVVRERRFGDDSVPQFALDSKRSLVSTGYSELGAIEADSVAHASKCSARRALRTYLQARPQVQPDHPLFLSTAPSNRGTSETPIKWLRSSANSGP
jgi:hypothetical protein